MKRVFLLMSLACLLLVMNTGCASIIKGGTESVNITSNPSGASISISNSKGKEVYKGTTPTVINLKKGNGYFSAQKYSVTFEKDGYKTKTAEIAVGISGWYIAGNFVFGGFIGWLVVDPLTGAMWTLKDLNVDLISGQANDFSENEQIRIVTLDQVPEYLRASMVRIQ